MKISRDRTPKQRPDVVSDVRRQVEQAAALADIAGQDRLADPELNPHVRGLADQLRDDRHGQLLRDAHRRGARQIRVLDQRAEAAARTLTLIQQAREATSPAHSVLALTHGRSRFVAAALAVSAVLSAGAAYGLGHLAKNAFGVDQWVGWVAELGLSGLATLTIAYRAHLFRHGGKPSKFQARLLLALVIVPLAASVVGNAFAHGAVGVICSLGAAATALLGHTMADASADAIQARAREVSDTDEAELRAVALGEDLAPVGESTSETTVEDTDEAMPAPIAQWPVPMQGRPRLPIVPAHKRDDSTHDSTAGDTAEWAEAAAADVERWSASDTEAAVESWIAAESTADDSGADVGQQWERYGVDSDADESPVRTGDDRPEPVRSTAPKPRPNRGVPVPSIARQDAAERPARTLSDAEHADRLEELYETGELPEDASKRAVGSALGIGFRRVDRVLSLVDERRQERDEDGGEVAA